MHKSLIEKLAKLIVKWNVEKTYSITTCNCQHFVNGEYFLFILSFCLIFFLFFHLEVISELSLPDIKEKSPKKYEFITQINTDTSLKEMKFYFQFPNDKKKTEIKTHKQFDELIKKHVIYNLGILSFYLNFSFFLLV